MKGNACFYNNFVRLRPQESKTPRKCILWILITSLSLDRMQVNIWIQTGAIRRILHAKVLKALHVAFLLLIISLNLQALIWWRRCSEIIINDFYHNDFTTSNPVTNAAGSSITSKFSLRFRKIFDVCTNNVWFHIAISSPTQQQHLPQLSQAPQNLNVC